MLAGHLGRALAGMSFRKVKTSGAAMTSLVKAMLQIFPRRRCLLLRQ
jgi:hypothetical protein